MSRRMWDADGARPSPSARIVGGAGVVALSPASPASDHRPVRLATSVRLEASPAAVFAFHADVRNLPRITPGPARVLRWSAPPSVGDLQLIEVGIPPLAFRWEARIERFEPPRVIVDGQPRGPFRSWRHAHIIRPAADGSVLTDQVAFRLVPGRLGRLVDRNVVLPALRLLFAERHRRTRRLLAAGGGR